MKMKPDNDVPCDHPNYRFRWWNIAKVCTELKMSVCGSTEALDDDSYADVFQWLTWRLQHWEPSSRYAQFDDSIKSVLTQTIVIARRRHRDIVYKLREVRLDRK